MEPENFDMIIKSQGNIITFLAHLYLLADITSSYESG